MQSDITAVLFNKAFGSKNPNVYSCSITYGQKLCGIGDEKTYCLVGRGELIILKFKKTPEELPVIFLVTSTKIMLRKLVHCNVYLLEHLKRCHSRAV